MANASLLEKEGPITLDDLKANFRAGGAHPRRILSFESVGRNENTPPKWVVYFYGDPERTRTVDLQRDRLAC